MKCVERECQTVTVPEFEVPSVIRRDLRRMQKRAERRLEVQEGLMAPLSTPAELETAAMAVLDRLHRITAVLPLASGSETDWTDSSPR